MSDIKTILSKRFEKKKDQPSKMDQLAQQASSGSLSSFSGVFKISPLTSLERDSLLSLLKDYATDEEACSIDLEELSLITSEVKAIHNQAIILHGERIKKAQGLLSKYRDGAFSAWLMATYGNRQTPYNFLQYYEFYTALSQELQKQVTLMPKQVIYSLASRNALFEEKRKFILGYNGETKNELLSKLREVFPLDEEDLRQQKIAERCIDQLKKLDILFHRKGFLPTLSEKETILELLDRLKDVTSRKKG